MNERKLLDTPRIDSIGREAQECSTSGAWDIEYTSGEHRTVWACCKVRAVMLGIEYIPMIGSTIDLLHATRID